VFFKNSRSGKEDVESSRKEARVSAISGEDDGSRKKVRLAEQEKPDLEGSIDQSDYDLILA
jgi:hypothetical protein